METINILKESAFYHKGDLQSVTDNVAEQLSTLYLDCKLKRIVENTKDINHGNVNFKTF